MQMDSKLKQLIEMNEITKEITKFKQIKSIRELSNTLKIPIWFNGHFFDDC